MLHLSHILLQLETVFLRNLHKILPSPPRAFAETADVSGIIVTKLDGTAKGGSVFSVKEKLGIPVRFIGVGEGIDDLLVFDPDEFCEALFE